MALQDLCTKNTYAWNNGAAEAYWPNGQTIFRHQIPFAPAAEAKLMAEYGMLPEQRKAYYQGVAQGLQHEIAVSKVLRQLNLKSVLTYTAAEKAESNGSIAMLLAADGRLTPLTQILLQGNVPAITILDIISRLAVILRDLAQYGISHGNLSLDEIYLTSDNRILLGGWRCASGPNLPPPPRYNPDTYKALTGRQAATGHSDMVDLAAIAWNLFSGQPGTIERPGMPDVAPQYATNTITAALVIGRSGDPGQLQEFRKALSAARRDLIDSGASERPISIVKRPKYFTVTQTF